MREVFTSQTFPIGFILSPPVLNFPQAKQLFKKGYLSELPDPAGASFKLFAKSVADVGMAHVRQKAATARAGISELSRTSGASEVLNSFMQQRSYTTNASALAAAPAPAPKAPASATAPVLADAANSVTAEAPKRGLLARIFRSNAA